MNEESAVSAAEPLTPAAGRNARMTLKRELGVIPLVAVIFFSVSGGPFGLEDAIGSSGPGMALLMLLVVPIVFGIPCSMMAAELGTAIPVEGGYYYWIKLALGKPSAFVFGTWAWMNTFLDTALYPIVAADYISQWVPGTGRGDHVLFSFFDSALSIDTHWAVAIAVMVPLAWLNARGSRWVGDTSTLLMLIVLAPFVILSVIGVWHALTTPDLTLVSSFTLPGQGSGAAFGAALGVVIWNYIGWEDPSTVLGEVKNPQRTYSRALLISVPLITLSYILPMIAALASGLHSGHPQDWTDGDFANAGRLLSGHWLALFVTIGALLGNIGLFSSLLMSGSRVPRVLAGDGYLPRSLAEDSPKYGTPVRAIVISCLVFAVFCSMNFTALLDADVLTDLACILMDFAALIVLRKRYPNMVRPYKIKGGWPALALLTAGPVVFTGWLAQSTYVEEPDALWIGVIILLLGVLAYYPAKKYIKRGRADQPVDTSMIDLGDGVEAAPLFV